MNNTDQTVAQAPRTFEPSKIWRPVRPIAPIDPTDDRINQLQGRIAKVTGSVASINTTITDTAAGVVGAPAQVTGVSVAVTAKNINGTLMAVLDVSFVPHANFASAQLWVTGYNGNSSPQLLTQAFTSPIEYAAQITNELVTLTVVALNSSGVAANFATAPSATVLLNGASTAPPAPTINQSLVALSGGTGWQFAFNVINGLLADVITGYWVYRSASHVTPTSPTGRFMWIPQPPSTVPYTFQDVTGATYFYWVSAVSTSGLESALTDATATNTTALYYPTVAAGSYPNPERAYDGNTASSSGVSIASPFGAPGGNSASEVWSAFPAGPGAVTITAVVLEILSYASTDNHALALLEYNSGDGTGWHSLYSLNTADGFSSTAAYQYYTVSLPTTQDLTLVQVQASTSGISTHPTGGDPGEYDQGTATQNIYECRISVTYH